MKLEYGLGDVVQMKKEHPCKKSKTFTIVRMGADVKIECDGCGTIIMLERSKFDKRLKKVITRKEEI